MRALQRIGQAQQGSALVMVLAVITLMTILAGLILGVFVMQHRFIHRDVHRQQARYLAEAGVYVALGQLQADPYWRADAVPVVPAEGDTSFVSVASFGGYLWVRATARKRHSRYTIRALVGQVPTAPLRNAVYVWDTASSLNLAGTTRITGDVVVGSRGVRMQDFKGRPFRGAVAGQVLRTPGLAPPYFDPGLVEETLAQCEQRLQEGPRPSGAAPGPGSLPLPGDNSVLFFPGDGMVSAADTHLWAMPHTVVAAGHLAVEGPLHFPPGTQFIAGRALRVRGGVRGREGLFYGREGVDVSGGVRAGGAVLSRATIHVADSVRLTYPSVLYVTGEAAGLGGGIRLEGSAVVEGMVLHPGLEPPPLIPQGRVVVGASARVRGGIYNGLETELHGTLEGTLMTFRAYFYESPTSYVNWLKDVTIEVTRRPVTYLLPLRFSVEPLLEVVRWETRLEDAEE